MVDEARAAEILFPVQAAADAAAKQARAANPTGELMPASRDTPAETRAQRSERWKAARDYWRKTGVNVDNLTN